MRKTFVLYNVADIAMSETLHFTIYKPDAKINFLCIWYCFSLKRCRQNCSTSRFENNKDPYNRSAQRKSSCT